MKSFFLKGTLIFGILLIMVASCKKDNPSGQVTSTDEFTALADQAGTNMDNQEVYSDDPSQTIYMLNDGIAVDFLVNENCMDDQNSGKDSTTKYIKDHSFMRCLKGLALSDSQFVKVKHGLREYNACSDHSIKRVKAIYHDLKEKYHVLYLRLWNAFQNGTITKEEFKRKVAQLRIDFKKEVLSLHLKEKLHDALKHCLRVFFKDLHSILTERQWNAFVKCYKQ